MGTTSSTIKNTEELITYIIKTHKFECNNKQGAIAQSIKDIFPFPGTSLDKELATKKTVEDVKTYLNTPNSLYNGRTLIDEIVFRAKSQHVCTQDLNRDPSPLIWVRSGGGKKKSTKKAKKTSASAYRLTKRKTTTKDGKVRSVYTKDGKDYVKRISATTGKAVFRQV